MDNSCSARSSNQPDDDAFDKLSVASKNLHSGSLAAAVTDDNLARRADDSNLARIPQLPLLFTRHAKVILEVAVLAKHLR